MAKSPDAFRTISEVADWLRVEAHVLRFWETRFTQVKPVKRAGGRRYYRPSDMALLGGIRKLLHDDGLTIRGVQKILREHGVSHVAGMSPELAFDAADPPAHVRPEAAPTVRPVQQDAPPLPLDLPPVAASAPRRLDLAPAALRAAAPAHPPAQAPPAAAQHETASSRPNLASDHDGKARQDGAAMAALLRRGAAADPERAAAVLARARDLLERLRSTPG